MYEDYFMQNNHSQNIEKWFSYIEANKFKKSHYWLPADKILKRFGVEKPPVYFWSFKGIALAIGGYFGLVWGAVMYFLVWAPAKMPLAVAFGTAVCTGALFGLAMAWYVVRSKKKLGLTTWEAFLSSVDKK